VYSSSTPSSITYAPAPHSSPQLSFPLDRRLACRIRGTGPRREYYLQGRKKNGFGVYARISIFTAPSFFFKKEELIGESIFHVPSGAQLEQINLNLNGIGTSIELSTRYRRCRKKLVCRNVSRLLSAVIEE